MTTVMGRRIHQLCIVSCLLHPISFVLVNVQQRRVPVDRLNYRLSHRAGSVQNNARCVVVGEG
jgi:hypothetical protein